LALEIKAPHSIEDVLTPGKILMFLGGSIEMGTAKDWQKKVNLAFKDNDDVVLLNPRRDHWDSSWKQSKHNKKFREQVEWELYALERSNIILMYFDPKTKSPVSLLELGLFAHDFGKNTPIMHVVCPTGFWRKGNVDIVCERYSIPQFTSLKSATDHLKENLEDFRFGR
jgi:hypothetical protein